MINILGKRYYYFALSLLIIIPGLIIILLDGLSLSIDFTGGTYLEVRFGSGTPPQPAEVVLLYKELGVDDVLVQTTNRGSLVARSSFLDDETRSKILSMMEDQFGQIVTVLRYESVGPTIGQEVTSRAAIAVALAAIGVLIYIMFAFRGIPNALRYGICGIIAMLHDVLIVISLAAIGRCSMGMAS